MRIEVELQVTSPEAAMEGGMAMATGQSRAGWEMMLREAETHTLRAEPIGGSGQLAHPANHYSED